MESRTIQIKGEIGAARQVSEDDMDASTPQDQLPEGDTHEPEGRSNEGRREFRDRPERGDGEGRRRGRRGGRNRNRNRDRNNFDENRNEGRTEGFAKRDDGFALQDDAPLPGNELQGDEFIDDDDLAVFHDIVDILGEHGVRLKRLIHVMHQRDIMNVV